jgi:hypothetical protein
MKYFLILFAVIFPLLVSSENFEIDATAIFKDRRQLDQITNVFLDSVFSNYKEYYKTNNCSLFDKKSAKPCPIRMLAVTYDKSIHFGDWNYPDVNYPTLAFVPQSKILNHGDVVIYIYRIVKNNDDYDYYFLVGDGDRWQSGESLYRVKLVDGKYESHYVSSVD